MFELFKIMGSIGVDNSEANQALDETDNKAGETSKSIGQKMQDGLGKAEKAIGNVGTSMTKWVTGPIVGAGVGVLGLMTQTGNYADRLLDLSDITGMSTDALQEWGYVADIAGVSNEAVSTAVAGLVRRLPQMEKEGGKANEAMEKLGLSYDELGKLTPDEQIDTLMNSLSEMEDPLERNAVGSSLFGGAWQDLAPILGMGADEIAKTRDEAHELGAVMGNEGLQDANSFRQEMERLKNEFAGAFREISNKFLPIFQEQLLPLIQNQIIPAIMDFADRVGELIEWFTSLDPSVQGAIGKFIALITALGPILIVVGKIIGAIKLLIPIFGLLFSPIGAVIAIVAGLIAIGVALYQNWDVIKEKAAELGNWLATVWDGIKTSTSEAWNAIKESLSQAWESITTTVSNAVQSVRDWISNTWQSIKNTTSNVFNAIRNTISSVLNAVRNVVSNVFNAIRNTISNVLNTARNIVSNILNTIRNTFSNIFNGLRNTVSNAFSNVTSAVRNGMTSAFNTIKGFFGRFKNAGRNIVTSIADGITGAIGRVTDAIGGVVSKVRDFLPFSPAKEGPLTDIHKLNFGGPIEHSIEADENKVQQALKHMLEVPDVAKEVGMPGNGSSLSGGNHSNRRTQETSRIEQLTNELLNKFDNLANRPIELEVTLDGRVIARATRDPMDKELGLKERDKNQAKGRR